jgi:iron complex outermembrane receptor protein
MSLADTEGNPFQEDLVSRGFTASPVLGTPQGLALYQNGVRINEAFGDIVLWDFIPVFAIKGAAGIARLESNIRPECSRRGDHIANEGRL